MYLGAYVLPSLLVVGSLANPHVLIRQVEVAEIYDMDPNSAGHPGRTDYIGNDSDCVKPTSSQALASTQGGTYLVTSSSVIQRSSIARTTMSTVVKPSSPTSSFGPSVIILQSTRSSGAALQTSATSSSATKPSQPVDSTSAYVTSTFVSYSNLTSASSTSPATSSICTASGVTPPAPTNSGTVSGCTQWYVPVAGDYCYTVAQKFNISTETFMQWNPSVIPPGCTRMLAGDAYCVAVCGEKSSSSVSVTSTAVSLISTISSIPTSSLTILTTTAESSKSFTSQSPLPSASSSALNVYRSFNGDGSVADGWPAQSQWLNYTYMFELNTPLVAVSCNYDGVPDNSDEETEELSQAIVDVGSAFGMDPRFILAIVMQESRGCVRVKTTSYSHANPGLMQSYEGTGTCNNNTADVQDPGVSQSYPVLNPCPYSEIHQMILDGVNGTAAGPGLVQNWANQTNTAPDYVSNFYRTARIYNGGALDPSDLAEPCCTASYASDLANRLLGWTDGEETFQAT